ncbi:MAG: hypothetical protein QW655_01885 [Nitrososphaerota archaeon]
MKRAVGLITTDMKIASMVREVASKMKLKVFHVLDVGELPIHVNILISTRSEKIENIEGREIIYIDDYRDIEEAVEKAVEKLSGIEKYERVIVAIDPGKTIGVAYTVNGVVIKTCRYEDLGKMVIDLKDFLERHKDSYEKTVIIGSTSMIDEALKFMEIIREPLKDVVDVKIEIVDEAKTSRGLISREKEVSKDEYSAILLFLRKKHL